MKKIINFLKKTKYPAGLTALIFLTSCNKPDYNYEEVFVKKIKTNLPIVTKKYIIKNYSYRLRYDQISDSFENKLRQDSSHEELRTYALSEVGYNLKLSCSHGEFSVSGNSRDKKISNLTELLLKNRHQKRILPYYKNKKDGNIEHNFFGISTNYFLFEDPLLIKD